MGLAAIGRCGDRDRASMLLAKERPVPGSSRSSDRNGHQSERKGPRCSRRHIARPSATGDGRGRGLRAQLGRTSTRSPRAGDLAPTRGLRCVSQPIPKEPFMANDHVLTLVCASCGRIFASTVQMEPKTPSSRSRMNRQMECCPACGRASRYSKADYLFRSGDPSQWGVPRILGER